MAREGGAGRLGRREKEEWGGSGRQDCDIMRIKETGDSSEEM